MLVPPRIPFPWDPPLSANIAQQERSPPIANAHLPQTLPLPMAPQNENENVLLGREYHPEPQNIVEQQAVNQNEGNVEVIRNPRRRRARSRDSNESNDSYEPRDKYSKNVRRVKDYIDSPDNSNLS